MAPTPRLRSALANVDIAAAVEREPKLRGFRDRLAVIRSGGEEVGRERAQKLVERLVVGVFDQVTAKRMEHFSAEMANIGRLRGELTTRYGRVLDLFGKPGEALQLPAGLQPAELSVLFDQLDVALDDLSAKISRRGLLSEVAALGTKTSVEDILEPPVAEHAEVKPDLPVDPSHEPPPAPATNGAAPAPQPPRVGSTDPRLIPDPRTAGTGGIQSIHYNLTTSNQVEVVITGTLKPAIAQRSLNAPNYNTESIWGRLRKEHNVDWEAAHLWGPGFGDEAAAGIMLAPREVNQVWQNRGVEQFLRQLRDEAAGLGGVVEVRAVATSQVGTTEMGGGTGFLAHVQYEFSIATPAGKSTRAGFVEFSVGSPPNGKVSEPRVSRAAAGASR